MTSRIIYTLKTRRLGLVKVKGASYFFSAFFVAKHTKHNQCEHVYNTVIRSCITFEGHSKVRGILPMPSLGEPHRIFMNLLYTAQNRCVRLLFYRRFTKAFQETATCTVHMEHEWTFAHYF